MSNDIHGDINLKPSQIQETYSDVPTTDEKHAMTVLLKPWGTSESPPSLILLLLPNKIKTKTLHGMEKLQ